MSDTESSEGKRATLVLCNLPPSPRSECMTLTALGNLAAARDAGHEIVLITSSAALKRTEGTLAHRVIDEAKDGAAVHRATLAATGQLLLFARPDLRLNTAALSFLSQLVTAAPSWGWFKLRAAQCPHPATARLLNVCAAFSRCPEPEMGLFVHRNLLHAVGGLHSRQTAPLRNLARRLRRCMQPQPDAPRVRSELAAFHPSVLRQLSKRLTRMPDSATRF